MTCCRSRLPEISNSGEVDLVYWPNRLRCEMEKAISGSRNANARKTWNLRQSDMVLDHTKSTGKEQMNISVMMSKAVITCQRRNCCVANVRSRVSTPRHISYVAYLFRALARMCRRQHPAMVAIGCDSNHRCKAPNGTEG